MLNLFPRHSVTRTFVRSASAAANMAEGEKPSWAVKRLGGKVAWTVLYFLTSSL